MRTSIICTVQLCIALTVLSAQAPKPPTGTVTGHVICQDTQRPARFAQVVVFSVPPVAPADDKIRPTDSKSIQSFMRDAMSSASIVTGETGFDGSFSIDGIDPGDYYIMASVGGYVQPREIVQAAYDAGEDVSMGLSGIPVVRVSADRSVDAEITVTRGAAIEGHVLWDDGAPINAATVQAEPKTGEHKPLPMQFNLGLMNSENSANTDDRGHYRISGLAPGEYIVRVMLQTNRRMSMRRGRFDPGYFGPMPLMVYAPGGFRKTDAKPFTLAAGEERTDEDITFKLGSTHTVSGRVTSAEDHHGLNRGLVALIDSQDKNFRRSAALDTDGNFDITFVPSGTYTMIISNGADTVLEEPKKSDSNAIFGQAQTKAVRTYEKSEQQVMVADDDLTGQNIELKPVKTPENATETANQ